MLPVVITTGALIVFNTIAWSLAARWYIVPRLSRMTRAEALSPLLLVHLVRPISLWTTLPGVVVAQSMPLDWSYSTAVGDLLATAFALLAIFAVRRAWRMASALVWLFNIIGLADALKNGVLAAKLGVMQHMGAAVFVPTYIVPILLVSHGLIFWVLLRHPDRAPSFGASSG